MPSHSHSASCSTNGNHYHGAPWDKTSEAPDTPYGWYDASNNHAGLEGVHSDRDNAIVKTSTDGNHSHSVTIGATGGNGMHENRMPYQVVSFWRRTA